MVKGRDRSSVLAYAYATWEGSSRGRSVFGELSQAMFLISDSL